MDCVVSTQACERKIKTKNDKKKRERKQRERWLIPKKSYVVLYLHLFLGLLVNECVTLLQSNTHNSIYTKNKK